MLLIGENKPCAHIACPLLYYFFAVGGSVDRACKIEAILCSLSNRRKELRIEQTKIDNQFIRYINELQHSLKTDEDLTVILADAFTAPPFEEDIVAKNSVEIEEKKSASPDHYPQKPPKAEPEQQITPPRSTRFSCFGGSVFGSSGESQEEAQLLLRSALTNPEWRTVASANSQEADPEASRLFPSATHPSPSAMRAGAQAWREQNGRAAATENGINFRTGMSGHMALLSTHAHPHEYLDGKHRPIRMSSHTGLTMTKLPSLQGILSSLTLPVIGSNCSPSRGENDNQIHHTGSM